MDSVKLLRRILVLLTVVVVLAVCLLIFQFTDVAFRVWDRLQQTNKGFLVAYVIGIVIIACLGLLLIYKIWTVGRSKKTAKPVPTKRNLEEVRTRLEQAREKGVDVAEVARDLETLNAGAQTILKVAFFGKISTGKSSLIQTLIPNAHIETSIIGGSTSTIDRYDYRLDNGLELLLLDMPGTHQAQSIGTLDKLVMEETRRVHIVCYVIDQDLTASDIESIALLQHFDKPLLVVLNKVNRYRADELTALKARIAERLPDAVHFVCTESRYERSVQRVSKDGHRETVKRMSHGDVSALLASFAQLESARGELASAQQQALLSLADDTLTEKLGEFRQRKGQALVKSYAKKAMLGGVAAVGPGTDVLIQGYLGVDMMKSLCKLYDVPVQEIDLQALVEAATSKVKGHLTVILALAGNVCKAFPGLGTIIGGASHAVAYGLIFESLGNAALYALEHNENGFSTQTVLNAFENQLQRDLEKRAGSLIQSVLKGKHDE